MEGDKYVIIILVGVKGMIVLFFPRVNDNTLSLLLYKEGMIIIIKLLGIRSFPKINQIALNWSILDTFMKTGMPSSATSITKLSPILYFV
ncbi:MAG: hypothetical protein ACRCZO_14235, partial [Cetobacterium sp.]